jgi:hypothetical protein
LQARQGRGGGAALVSCLWLWASHADERLWVPAKINGRSVPLGFDTGASDVLLWRAGAQRLNLKFTAPQTNQGSRGTTVLHLAAQAGCVEGVTALLSHGAAVKARDDQGRTPLKRAEEWHRSSVIPFLKEHGGKE